ncbi:MAG: restriction endonuclease subunit S [Candidatus Brocadiales bacterium]|nr:restriction endonuclease subunit S [Candidatus Brocadiales bacterium]
MENMVLKLDKSSWTLTKLGDLAKDISKRVDNPGKSEYDRFVGLGNFVSGDIKIITWETTENLASSAKAFQTGDILFARRNAYLRRASLVDFDGCCSGDAFVLRENHDKVVPGFLAFLMNSNALWYFANSNAAGTMSKRVKWRDLAKYEFLLPPKDQQAQLAELLWAMDELIEREILSFSKYVQFLKRFLFDSVSGKLSNNLPNWKEYLFGSLGESFGGLSGKSKNDFGEGSPFINYMNVFRNSKIDPLKVDYVKIVEGENQNEVRYGDILITGSSETPEEVGMASVVLNMLEGYYLNSFCFGFRLNDFNTLLPEYARFLMRGEKVRKFMFKHAQGSTRFNLSKTTVKEKLRIVLPGISEQKEITKKLDLMENNISVFEANIARTKALQKSIINQIF